MFWTTFRQDTEMEEDETYTSHLVLVCVFSATTLVFFLSTTCLVLQLLRMRRHQQQLQQHGSRTDCSSCGSNSSCGSSADKRRPELRGVGLTTSDRQASTRLLPAGHVTCLRPQDWAWYPEQLVPAYRLPVQRGLDATAENSCGTSAGSSCRSTADSSCGTTADSSPGRQF